MIPGVGFVADVANGIWYCAEVRYFEAASSFVSSIPGAGDAIGLAAKGITGCSKASKVIRYVAGLTGKVGNFALGAYSTGSQICSMWDKYVIRGESWGPDSWKELVGVSFSGFSTVSSVKGIAADISNYRNVKHDIVTSQCFVEGTLVVTEDGDKPIEEIKAGYYVYSTNPETGESEYKEVLRTFRKESDVLIHIFVNGEEIETTPVHPFWVVDQWVSAKDLEAGDILTLADGTTAPVTDTYGEQLDEPVIVYNFEVSDFHTYYVTDTGVLVHNANNNPLNTCSVKKGRDKWGPEHTKKNPDHNNAIEDELDLAESIGASGINKNKAQVNADGVRGYYDGKHYIRPDASYVIDGTRFNTNYVSNPNSPKEVEREIKAFLNMCEADPTANNWLIFYY